MPAVPPPNFVRRRACRISCIATARTCARRLAGNPRVAVRRILFFVLGRRSTFLARRTVHNLSSTLTRGDLRQHHFQRLQRRRRRVQLWPPFRLVFLRDPPRAHDGLPWLTLVSLRPSCLDGRLPRLTEARVSGDSRAHLVATDVLHLFTSCLGAQLRVEPPPPLLSSQCHPAHNLSSSCSS